MTTKLCKRLGFYFVEQEEWRRHEYRGGWMLCVGRWEVKGIFLMEELRKLRKLFGQSAIERKRR
jgi:hypothetical protein